MEKRKFSNSAARRAAHGLDKVIDAWPRLSKEARQAILEIVAGAETPKGALKTILAGRLTVWPSSLAGAL
jgi:hypothetical protein